MLAAFRVADWRVDPSLHTVTGPSGPVRLEPKILQVLICLAERAPEVIARDRLIASVWGGIFVSDDVLARAISELRRILGDDARHPRIIETVPKGGYRLIAPVVLEEAGTPGLSEQALVMQPGSGSPGTVRAPLHSPESEWETEAVSTWRLRQDSSNEVSAPVLREGFPLAADRSSISVTRDKYGMRSSRAVPGAMLLGALVLAATSYLAVQWYASARAEPRVTEYRRITRHEVLFSPFPSEVPILTDGPRIYFNQFINGILRVGQVSAFGGETETLNFGLAQNEVVDAISPDGAELLVGAWNIDETVLGDVPFWIVPLVGDAPRRLGNVTAHGSCWLPDGRILYAHGHDLFVCDRAGGGSTKVASVDGRAYWPRLSPDGSRIRFARFSSASTFRVEALWEVRIDGTGLRPLLPGWNDPPSECCGEWTPDGAYYVFQSTREGQTHLWVMRDNGGWLGGATAPMQLTRGPVQFRRPIFSRDGRKIFANGWQARGELTRLDPRSGALTPYLKGLSAEWLTHSRDGQWIAYVTYPEGELWRASGDNARRLRLTAPAVRACCPRISPDARYVVFVGQTGDAAARTYVISMDGTGLREIGNGGEATWSPDGKQLVMGIKGGLAAFALDQGTQSVIPGSQDLLSPVWSTDGRRLAAISAVSGRLHVYDFGTGRWRQLESRSAGFPNWSRDGEDIYFFTGRPAPVVIDEISRWNVSSDRVERLTDVALLRLAWGIKSHWLGLAPDDSPLFLRERSIHDLYALDWRPRD